jgi:transposase-like protein
MLKELYGLRNLQSLFLHYRSLDIYYAILSLDTIQVKLKDQEYVRNKTIYVVMALI